MNNPNFPPPRSFYVISIIVLSLLAVFDAARVLASGPGGPITLPPSGCPMAHCDPQMSDQVNLTAQNNH